MQPAEKLEPQDTNSCTHSLLTAAVKRQSTGEVMLSSLMCICAHTVGTHLTSLQREGSCVHSPSGCKEQEFPGLLLGNSLDS